MDKNTIREMMKQKRFSIEEKTLSSYNKQIYQQVIHHPYYCHSKTIGIYVSFQKEVDTFQIIHHALQNHRVCVPKIKGKAMHFYEIHSIDDLKEGYSYILEPTTEEYVSPKEIELMIIPMLAFDSKKYRIGYGKGFYDHYLKEQFHGYKLGLAYKFQYVENTFPHKHDIPLDEIIVSL